MGTIIIIILILTAIIIYATCANRHDDIYRKRLIEIRKDILRSKTKEDLCKLKEELKNVFKKSWTDYVKEESISLLKLIDDKIEIEEL